MANLRKNEKSCALCEFASPMDVSGALYCQKRGPVHSNGRCRKFSPDIFKLQPETRKPAMIDEQLDFSIDPEK